MSLNASPAPSPLEISFPLPKTLYTTLHIHLTFLDTTAMVFLTTTSAGESQGTTKPMGSFVYALPDSSEYAIFAFLSAITPCCAIKYTKRENAVWAYDPLSEVNADGKAVGRLNHKSTVSTVLYTSPGTIDYARRATQALARRMNMPIYVGCSVELSGQTAEEEMEGLAKVVDTILAKWEETKGKQATCPP